MTGSSKRILKYVEDLKRGANAEVGPKDYFEIASNINKAPLLVFFSTTRRDKMRKYEIYPTYSDFFEYHGSNEILRIRKQYGTIIRKDWIVFNSPDEAMDHFNNKCGEYIGYYH